MNVFEYKKHAKEAAARMNNPEVIILKKEWERKDRDATSLLYIYVFLLGTNSIAENLMIYFLILGTIAFALWVTIERNKIGTLIQEYKE